MDRFAALVPCHLFLSLEQPPVDVVAQRLVPEAADVDPRHLGRAQHLHTRRQVIQMQLVAEDKLVQCKVNVISYLPKLSVKIHS